MYFSQTSLRNPVITSVIDMEHERLRSKDIENKKLIQKLTGDLTRQKSNQLKDIVNYASNRRIVSTLF